MDIVKYNCVSDNFNLTCLLLFIFEDELKSFESQLDSLLSDHRRSENEALVVEEVSEDISVAGRHGPHGNEMRCGRLPVRHRGVRASSRSGANQDSQPE